MRKRPFTITEYVRWGDVDLAGIICYGAYIRFFELAETELFRAANLPYGEMFQRFDMWLPRRVMHTEFLSPALLDEQLTVAAYISSFGRTSMTINFDVMRANDGALRATAYQVLACVGRSDLKKKPLPETFVNALGLFTMSTEEARESLRA